MIVKSKLRPLYGYRDGKRYSKGYYAEFYHPHRRPRQKRITLRTRDESIARARLAKLEERVGRGLFDPWSDSADAGTLLVSEAAAQFIRSKEGLAPKTLEDYEGVLRRFDESLPVGVLVAAVGVEHVRAFLDRPGLSEASRDSYARTLRVFFRWCKAEGHRPDVPMPARKRGKAARLTRAELFFTEEQIDRLLDTIRADAKEHASITDGNRWLTDVVRFAVGTGLRRGEICALRWGAVDFNRRLLHVQNTETHTTKSGRERPVPLVGDALAVLEERRGEQKPERSAHVFLGMKGGPLNPDHLSKRFRHYRARAELPGGLHFHSLRHTFASWFVQRGGDLYRLKELLGHAGIEETLRYAHLRPEALREEMEKCFGLRPPEREGHPYERLRSARSA